MVQQCNFCPQMATGYCAGCGTYICADCDNEAPEGDHVAAAHLDTDDTGYADVPDEEAE